MRSLAGPSSMLSHARARPVSPLVPRRLPSTCLASPHAARSLTALCLSDPSLGTGLPVCSLPWRHRRAWPGSLPQGFLIQCSPGTHACPALCRPPWSGQCLGRGQRAWDCQLHENYHGPPPPPPRVRPACQQRSVWGDEDPPSSPLQKSLLLGTTLTTWVAGTGPEEGPSEALGLPEPAPQCLSLSRSQQGSCKPPGTQPVRRPEGSVCTVLLRRQTALCA